VKGKVDTVFRIHIKYAKGFWLEEREGYVVLNIKDPQESSHTHYQYALVPRGSTVQTPKDLPVVALPVRSAICMTSLQLSNFIKLGAMDRVVGITSTRFLFNKDMQRQVDEGLTRRIGIEGNFDNEVIMSINPDLMLISPFKRGGYDAVKDIGIPLVPHLGYKEMTPLGQAEWIKFVGLLLGMEDVANREFDRIEQRYNSLKAMVGEVKYRPVVFSGELRGGVWYAVGGKSFLAQLFHDAGADYFLKDDPRSGGVTLDFETVYNQAESADYWRIANSFAGEYCYEALKAQDERYADFKAFKEKHVVYCNMREKPFYESMPAEPEVVLADMIRVFHPEILPDHEPVYYDILKK
jgi:putative lipoprotein